MPVTTADAVRLAEEQAALRRVAELVATGAQESEVFERVTHEACGLLGGHFTALVRYEPGDAVVVVAASAAEGARDVMPIGVRLAIDADGVADRVRRSAQAVRLDSYEDVPGTNAARARGIGLTGGIGAPIAADGEVWGAIIVLGRGPPLPAGAEYRLEVFAALAGTALAGARARASLLALAREQASLRRVAELVAGGAAPADVFAAVANEAARLLDGVAMTLTRFESELEMLVVASCGGPTPVDTRIAFVRETLPDRVRREDRTVRVDDYQRERDAALATRYGLAAAVAAPISVGGQVWGMLTATSGGAPLPAGTEDRLLAFAELVAAALASSQARAEIQALADEQAALRRVAELVAQEAPTASVLRAVAVQASRLAAVEFGMVLRFEPDGSTEIVALDGAPENFRLGLRAPAAGDSAVRRVWLTGRPARIDDLGRMAGTWPQMAHRYGFTTSAGVPILLQGRLWGAILVVGRGDPFPPAIEPHLSDFAELVATGIAAAQARAELRVLADGQTSLRRVAERVARGAPLAEVFEAVAREASAVLGVTATALLRFGGDDAAVVVAAHPGAGPPGLRIDAGPAASTGDVLRTGSPVRADELERTPLAGLASKLGIRAGVAVPVTVEARVWGTLTASSAHEPLPSETEDRLAEFAELAGAAIANAENRAKLTASRARVIATADETRRRLQRDVHDGAQQRLVHTLMTLRLAQEAAARGRPTETLIEQAFEHAQRANRELRDVVHGILPAALSRGGLRPGLESLLSDVPLPVDLRVTTPRLPGLAETTAYFVVAEALTNVIKHARASRAAVEVAIEGDRLTIEVCDDGVGGADPGRGTGLIGLLDRVEAADGTLAIDSPPGAGTKVRATLGVARPPHQHARDGTGA